MEFLITPEAAQWYKKELNLKDGDSLQFYVKLYGQSMHPNFSLGIQKNERPQSAAYHEVVEGIHFYVSESDVWFFDGYSCTFSVKDGDIEFSFTAADQL